MNIRLEGDIEEFQAALDELAEIYGCKLDNEGGLRIRVKRWEHKNLKVTLNEEEGAIFFNQPIHFFRALGLLLEKAAHTSTFTIEETPQFTMNGIMLDCSRNGVMKPDQIKTMVRMMAVMGLNMLMLYMEDTYEIEEQPYFGYRRGRYSKEELKELDDYADQFGIELIPSIQTLAHLATFLRWDGNEALKDTSDILLSGAGETYELIEQMITSVMQPFRTKRIHIGMDEAHLLGRGQYLKKYGYRPSFEIMNDHLKEVLQITRKKGLDPMIWSDMYFRLGSEKGHYYDLGAHIPEDVIEEMPKDVQYVYWDYYHEDEEFYRTFLQKHQSFGAKPLFAGGIWTWNGVSIHYPKTFRVIESSYSACKKEGIQEVFSTLWGDNGAETNPFQSLLGLQLVAEHGYAVEPDRKKVRERFAFCTGADMEAFLKIGELDQPPGYEEGELEPANPSKYLLWQDPFVGLFDKQGEGLPLNTYYGDLHRQLEEAKKKVGTWSWILEVPGQICAVLSLKSELNHQLKTAYEEKDSLALQQMKEQLLPNLFLEVERLRDIHYEQWMKVNKPFGWEVLDIRYGGLMARIRTAIRRLSDYLRGHIPDLPELEEARLPFSSRENGYVRCNDYQRIASANPL
ncbi:beta-N-acetylhexosaminidase [Halobacillus sp. HZG1]|uniref:beta-N-acetylhexosaminidase n=1 Tax=Halobacillus sp. HZG1 TaxID=3111769 RepID=UPI002DBD8590|nr:beta-N-acetylhexosaminidase [Halobacillus sp. HZG1]MEC3884006.1 beta-N-acetylhexosaminidase [Halobacillus sp. HZG1]